MNKYLEKIASARAGRAAISQIIRKRSGDDIVETVMDAKDKLESAKNINEKYKKVKGEDQ